MNINRYDVASDDLFYTTKHDWVRFSGAGVYIGIAPFKLTGIPHIEDIRLLGFKTGDWVPRDALLLNLHYRDYIIPVYAPLNCTLLELNNIVENGSWEQITGNPEKEGWLFKVEPQQLDNSHLLHHSLYRQRRPFCSIIQR